MVQKIALRASAAILILAGLALLALLVLGLTRAIASSASTGPADNGTEVPAAEVAENPAKPAPETVSIDVPDEIEPPKSSPLPLASSSPFTVKRVLQIDEPFVHGFYKWDDEGVPDGPIIITVDLKAESISVFRGGYEIGAAAILFGADEKPTPTGVFPITQKSKDHVSNLYHTPMPYMLRMTNDGISIHGSDVEYGYATHGCI
ncbi:MAG: L,D-transpeptidase family protein, partial [Pseudomonadota bacterium]